MQVKLCIQLFSYSPLCVLNFMLVCKSKFAEFACNTQILSIPDIDHTLFIFRVFYLEDGGSMAFPEGLYLSTRPQWCNIQAVSIVHSDHHNNLKLDGKLKSNAAEELHIVIMFVSFSELKKNALKFVDSFSSYET